MKMTKRYAFLIAVTAALACTATVSAYWMMEIQSVYKVIDMGMDVYVAEPPGINVDTDAVHFGKIPPGASGSRELTVTAGNYDTMVVFEHYGSIAEWTSVSDNYIMLKPNESREVMVQVTIPEDIVPLVYRNGTLRIVFRRAFLW